MKSSSKAWLLIAVGGAMLSPGLMFVLLATGYLGDGKTGFGKGYFYAAQEFFGMFILGAVFTGVVGVPFMYLADRFFNRYRLRYVIGSVLASYALWSLLNSCPFVLNCGWEMHRSYRVDLYLGTGLATGIVFSLLVNWFERKK